MAICTNSLPFSLLFEQANQPLQALYIYEREEEIPEQSYIIIRENIDVNILFQSEDENCRLYMEGLESIGKVGEDDEIYLSPSVNSRSLFKHEDFPLIPGDYLIRIQLEGISYYTMLRVAPKQMTASQLQVMKEEIEQFLSGLAQETVYKKHNIGQGATLPSFLASKYTAIQTYYKAVLPAITDLQMKANYRIKKEYEMVAIEQAATFDERTAMYQLKHPEREHELKVPVSRLDYNVPENRWLKKMTLALQKELRELKDHSLQYEEIFSDELNKLKKTVVYQESKKQRLAKIEESFLQVSQVTESIQKLQKAFFRLQSSAWFSEIDHQTEGMMPHTLHLDPRYHSLFQMYRELKRYDEAENSLAPMLRWKRTDKLYEIWGFIQFLQILIKELQFVPISGWVFSASSDRNDFSIPSLKSNTKLVFQKGAVTLHFIYDGEIPLVGEETSERDQPLFTESSNNRPDMRLDLYEADVYIGSVLFDFKYRPLHYIWDETRVKYKISTMQKLVNYAVSCKSKFLFGNQAGARYIRPVHEVWALHPNVYSNYPNSKWYENHDLRIVQLSPGHVTDHISQDLAGVIEEMLNKRKIFR
ncbi:hypothetical protein ACFDTO_26860 [Microbacteriaceae bacterium 4G12]